MRTPWHQVFILLVLSSISDRVNAQKILYLKPFLSGQFPLCHYDRALGKASNFTASNLDIALGAGVDAQLQLNPKWRLSLGGHYGVYGFSYSIDVKETRRSSGNAAYILRIPLQVHYTVKDDIHFVRLDKINYAHLLVFRVYGLAGVSYNRVMPELNYGQLSIGSGGPIQISDQKPRIHRWNSGSVYVGAGLQFFSGDKDRLDVSLYYSRGLSRIAYQDLYYEIYNVGYNTRLWSRGSVLGFNVGYPIRLKRFKNK